VKAEIVTFRDVSTVAGPRGDMPVRRKIRPVHATISPIRSALFVVALCAFSGAPGFAQSAQTNRPTVAQLSSGCNGNGPGIIAGRAPNFVTGSVGSLRIIPADTDGDAFMSVAREVDGTYELMGKVANDPKAAAELAKNPGASPYIPHYTGPNTIDGVNAWQKARLTTLQNARAAMSAFSMSIVAKDGSYSCRGFPAGSIT
jgi:hypothetical protein